MTAPTTRATPKIALDQRAAVSHPLVHDVVDRAGFLGQFSAVDSVEIRAQVGGILSQIAFTDGQIVKKDDLLFVIDPRPYEIKVQQAAAQAAIAEAQLVLADKELVRAQQLKQSDFATAESVDQRAGEHSAAIARVDAAKQSLEDAELDLQYCRVLAPFSGKISNHRVSVCSLVTGSRTGAGGTTLLTTLVKLDPIYLDFDMSEDDFLKYQRANHSGQKEVKFRLSDESRDTRAGTLDFIDNAIDRSSGAIRARATVANADSFLLPGAFGRLEVEMGKPKPALLIPEGSLSLDQSRHIVTTVNAAGSVVANEVELGGRFGGLRVITSGLAATDRVIIVAAFDRSREVGREAQDGFAAAPLGCAEPAGCAECVAVDPEERLSIAADTALRPYAAAARARRETRDLARFVNGNADNKPVIGAAIAPVPAEGNEDLALKQRQRATLVLY